VRSNSFFLTLFCFHSNFVNFKFISKERAKAMQLIYNILNNNENGNSRSVIVLKTNGSITDDE